jgi:hypothetical protein
MVLYAVQALQTLVLSRCTKISAGALLKISAHLPAIGRLVLYGVHAAASTDIRRAFAQRGVAVLQVKYSVRFLCLCAMFYIEL